MLTAPRPLLGLWGDAVNVASRKETNGVPGGIHGSAIGRAVYIGRASLGWAP